MHLVTLQFIWFFFSFLLWHSHSDGFIIKGVKRQRRDERNSITGTYTPAGATTVSNGGASGYPYGAMQLVHGAPSSLPYLNAGGGNGFPYSGFQPSNTNSQLAAGTDVSKTNNQPRGNTETGHGQTVVPPSYIPYGNYQYGSGTNGNNMYYPSPYQPFPAQFTSGLPQYYNGYSGIPQYNHLPPAYNQYVNPNPNFSSTVNSPYSVNSNTPPSSPTSASSSNSYSRSYSNVNGIPKETIVTSQNSSDMDKPKIKVYSTDPTEYEKLSNPSDFTKFKMPSSSNDLQTNVDKSGPIKSFSLSDSNVSGDDGQTNKSPYIEVRNSAGSENPKMQVYSDSPVYAQSPSKLTTLEDNNNNNNNNIEANAPVTNPSAPIASTSSIINGPASSGKPMINSISTPPQNGLNTPIDGLDKTSYINIPERSPYASSFPESARSNPTSQSENPFNTISSAGGLLDRNFYTTQPNGMDKSTYTLPSNGMAKPPLPSYTTSNSVPDSLNSLVPSGGSDKTSYTVAPLPNGWNTNVYTPQPNEPVKAFYDDGMNKPSLPSYSLLSNRSDGRNPIPSGDAGSKLPSTSEMDKSYPIRPSGTDKPSNMPESNGMAKPLPSYVISSGGPDKSYSPSSGNPASISYKLPLNGLIDSSNSLPSGEIGSSGKPGSMPSSGATGFSYTAPFGSPSRSLSTIPSNGPPMKLSYTMSEPPLTNGITTATPFNGATSFSDKVPPFNRPAAVGSSSTLPSSTNPVRFSYATLSSSGPSSSSSVSSYTSLSNEPAFHSKDNMPPTDINGLLNNVPSMLTNNAPYKPKPTLLADNLFDKTGSPIGNFPIGLNMLGPNIIGGMISSIASTSHAPLRMVQSLLKTITDYLPNIPLYDQLKLSLSIASGAIRGLEETLNTVGTGGKQLFRRQFDSSNLDNILPVPLPETIDREVKRAIENNIPNDVDPEILRKFTNEILNDIRQGLAPQLKFLKDNGYEWW